MAMHMRRSELLISLLLSITLGGRAFLPLDSRYNASVVAFRLQARTFAPPLSLRHRTPMSHQDFLFDKRIIQRNLEKGLIDSKDVEKRTKGLTDLVDAATVTSFDAVLASDAEEDGAETADDNDDEE